MFIRLYGKQYDFRNCEIDFATNDLVFSVETDDTVQELAVSIGGNPLEALQITASVLSQYPLGVDIDKELNNRGIYVNSCKKIDEYMIPDKKYLVGVKQYEGIEDVVAISTEGVVLLKGSVETDYGMLLEHTKGVIRVLKPESITSITFNHLLGEILECKTNKVVYYYITENDMVIE